MQRPLLLLVGSSLLVACHSATNPASSADAGPRFSWQKDAPAAAADNTRASVIAVRADLGLVELSRTEKENPKTRLQLTKGGKNIVVEVIKADEKSTVTGIVAGPGNAPELKAGDEVSVAVLAQ
jgi:hypothetical protein